MAGDLLYRMRALLRRRACESDLDAELRFHIEHRTQVHMEAGLPPEEAERRARLELGGVEQVKEKCRDQRGTRLLDSLWQDLGFGIRVFRRNRLFSAVVVLSLALGIGMTSALFSMVYAMLIAPFPYRDASNIAFVMFDNKRSSDTRLWFPVAGYLELKRGATQLEDSFAFRRFSLTVTRGLPEPVGVASFSSEAFSFLGVPALIGRTFGAAEFSSPAEPAHVMVLGYAFWRRHFAGNPAAIGKTLELDHQTYTVIGVMPPRFTWDGGDVFLPLTPNPAGRPEVEIVVRPKPGVGMRRASVELNAIAHRLFAAHPELYPKGDFRVWASSLADQLLGSRPRTLLILSIASGFLLLIACTNVSILLLAGGAVRRQEMATRTALGASAARIVRQLLTESVLLSLAGGALGLALGWWALRLLLLFMPDNAIPHELVVRMNGPVVAVTFLLSVLTGILFGLMPALELSRLVAIQSAPERVRTRNLIVCAEVALTMILLAGTATAVRGLVAIHQVRLGYDPANVVTLGVPLPEGRYNTWETRSAVFERILLGLKTIPGVQYASATPEAVPPRTGFLVPFEIAGQSTGNAMMQVGLIGGEYFRALRIPLLRGRFPTDDELRQAGPVAVINEEMARRFWTEGRNPIGARVHVPALKFGNGIVLNPPGGDQWFRVVGVVGTALNEGLRRPPSPSMYISYKLALVDHCDFIVRTAGEPHGLFRAIRQRVHEVEADQSVSGPLTLDEAVDADERAFPLFLATLFGLFGGVALALSATGLHSVVSYSVSRRTQELGIRMALGAQRADVLRLVLAGTVRLIGVGLLMGAAASVVAMRAIAPLLQDWNASEPLPYAAVVLVLLATGLLAAWIPAARATRIEPVSALRHQ
ncbi:MAG: ABC transporter permease [Bryobacteraceae bacterium]